MRRGIAPGPNVPDRWAPSPDSLIFWRCAACGFTSHQVERPTDHWTTRLDGNSRICRGPFEQWKARRV